MSEAPQIQIKPREEFFVIPQHIFRTYDIRGHGEKELTDEVVERIGHVFGKRVLQKIGKKACIGIGRDERISSPRIFKALLRGLYSHSLKVVDLGKITTPMAYFAHYELHLDAILQVTASHNPQEDNGMKMMIGHETLFGEDIISLGTEAKQVEHCFLGGDKDSVFSSHEELRKKYITYLHHQFQFSKKFNCVLDCGNGMVGSIARDVFEPYCQNLEILFEDVDCSFPNHLADPTIPDNLEPLRRHLLASRGDIGFAFDGDGDRLGIITAKGRILWGDEILMLLSELVLKEKPGATIIGEVKCSEKLFRMIREKGGKPLMYRTGHSLIKKKMKEVHAPLAGEMSGHLFFADRYFGFDDAVYAALRVLEVVDKFYLDLDAWIQQYPSGVITPEIRIACLESEKEKRVQQVQSWFSKQKDVHLDLVDGVRVTFPDGAWALVRASNTQAVLVVRIEAPDMKRLKHIQSLLEKALGKPF